MDIIPGYKLISRENHELHWVNKKLLKRMNYLKKFNENNETFDEDLFKQVFKLAYDDARYDLDRHGVLRDPEELDQLAETNWHSFVRENKLDVDQYRIEYEETDKKFNDWVDKNETRKI